MIVAGVLLFTSMGVVALAVGPLTTRLSSPAAQVTLHRQPIPEDPEQLERRFTPCQIELLEKLNRCDRAHLPRLSEILVPDRWGRGELAYSPLPARWAGAQHHAKALLVSQAEQAFGAYERGALVHWGPVSSGGKRRPTPQGLFYLNWKSPGRHSTLNRNWYLRWYFNFINERGISFHEYELPGRPASHGCVRLLPRDAQWLYEWGEQWELGEKGWPIRKQGTPVLILGAYDFDRHEQQPPWLAHTELPALMPLALTGLQLPPLAVDGRAASDATVLGSRQAEPSSGTRSAVESKLQTAGGSAE